MKSEKKRVFLGGGGIMRWGQRKKEESEYGKSAQEVPGNFLGS